MGSHPPLVVPWGHKARRRPPLPRRSGPEALPEHDHLRPGRLTLVGLRQRVLPFQVLERLTRPDLPWPLPRSQQKEKEQHPGPVSSGQTPPPPSPTPRGCQSRGHLSHRRPFIKSPPSLTSHLPMEQPSRRPIGSRRVPAPTGEHLTDWLAWVSVALPTHRGGVAECLASLICICPELR